ncbi:MAG TPA: hypothetical protein PK513_02425 [Alphaproteobacteria bacterium]|nr:hypothetical protein [Alphaproteobacteria bacterium]USO05909.1 MAG: hypothetical protein H6859_01515 [Rhodospirillales bacterium]HOO81341.1 hypothetical protein [Alphaproteobacteria bacterium]
MSENTDKKEKDGGCGGHCGCKHGEKGEQKNGEVLKTFDMYHFFSRKDVIFVMAFVIAFLIFTLAVKLAPEII